MVAMGFARMVLERCLNKPLIIVDREAHGIRMR